MNPDMMTPDLLAIQEREKEVIIPGVVEVLVLAMRKGGNIEKGQESFQNVRDLINGKEQKINWIRLEKQGKAMAGGRGREFRTLEFRLFHPEA